MVCCNSPWFLLSLTAYAVEPKSKDVVMALEVKVAIVFRRLIMAWLRGMRVVNAVGMHFEVIVLEVFLIDFVYTRRNLQGVDTRAN